MKLKNKGIMNKIINKMNFKNNCLRTGAYIQEVQFYQFMTSYIIGKN